jgi:hypothetical protein
MMKEHYFLKKADHTNPRAQSPRTSFTNDFPAVPSVGFGFG